MNMLFHDTGESGSGVPAAGDDGGCCSAVLPGLLAELPAHRRDDLMVEILLSAVRQRAKIKTLLDMLQDVDQLTTAASPGEMEEAALLFEDVAEQARTGAQLLKSLSTARLRTSLPNSALRPGETRGTSR